MQEGTHILKEGEELTPESKFYIVESGTVTCFRTIEVITITITTLCTACSFSKAFCVTQGSCRVKQSW